MTPVNCRVGHHPERNEFGDCVRACVATLLDMDGDAVPHFYHDNDADAGHARIVEFLAARGLTPYVAQLPGDFDLETILHNHRLFNPTAHYILFGSTGPDGGDHAVVCRGGEVVHNPAWVPSSLKGPLSIGVWQILLLVKA